MKSQFPSENIFTKTVGLKVFLKQTKFNIGQQESPGKMSAFAETFQILITKLSTNSSFFNWESIKTSTASLT